MSLMLSMLPVYLLGNFHCIGMCGPLVMMLGRHRYRYYYFLGRTLSFSLAAALAGGAGAILYDLLAAYHLPALVSFFFGFLLLFFGISTLRGWSLPTFGRGISQTLSLLLLKEKPLPTFLFGFFTVLLPCGQTLVVFAACALYGDLFTGFINGMAFALLTSPSLWLAMRAQTMLQGMRNHYNTILGICSLVVGSLAVCRGLAEAGAIPHLVINQNYHLVLY